MLRIASGCLLACVAPAVAAGSVGDSHSLIQAALEPKLKEQPKAKKQQAKAQLKPAYVNTWSNGFDGREFSFRHKVNAVEPGSGAINLFTRGCQTRDEKEGDNNCALVWGSENPNYVGVHLGTGFHSGDKLSVSVHSNAMTHNEEDKFIMNLFDGDDFEVNTTCQFCEGSCGMSYEKLGHWIKVELPSQLHPKEVCERSGEMGAPEEDYALLRSTYLPMGPFGSEFDVWWLKLVGDINARILLENRTGGTRIDESFTYKVGQGFGNSDAPSTALLQLEKGQRVERQEARGFLGLFRAAASQTFDRVSGGTAEQRDGDEEEGEGQQEEKHDGELEEGQEGQAKQLSKSQLLRKKAQETKRRKAAQQKKDDESLKKVEVKRVFWQDIKKSVGKIGTVSLNAKVWYNSAGNFSLTEPRFCKNSDARGSVLCGFPFGSPVSLKFSADLEQTLKDTDTMEVVLNPKIGGVLGTALKMAMKPTRLMLPACGTESEAQEVTVFEQTYHYVPPRCGTYRLSANLPPYVFDVPNYSSGKLNVPEGLPSAVRALIPKSIANLPPMLFEATVTLRHEDDEPMLSVTFEAGLN